MYLSLNSQKQIREAWRSALYGDMEEARQLLQAADHDSMPAEGADLLARLEVQDGRFAEARRIWQAILQVAPTYEPAVKALETLNTPWLFRAVCRKMIKMLVTVSCLSLAAIGAWALLVNIPDGYLSMMLAAWLAIVVTIFLAGVGIWILFMATPEQRIFIERRQQEIQDPRMSSEVVTTRYSEHRAGNDSVSTIALWRTPGQNPAQDVSEDNEPCDIPTINESTPRVATPPANPSLHTSQENRERSNGSY